MLRRVSVPASIVTLIACFAVIGVSGCDKSGSGTKKPSDVQPEPEPEPEPEPPKPSNEPSQSWEPLWATASGKPTANLVGVRDGKVYAIAGEFVDNGTPATHLVAFAEDTGALSWTFANKATLEATGASETLVGLMAGETALFVAVKNGKKAKPKKGEAEALTPFATPASADGCTAETVNLTCGDWTVAEGGAVGDLTSFEDLVCYSVATAREVRCRAMTNGNLAFAITVPAVEGVKDPEATNFQFAFANGKLFISNYDGTVLAFGPAGGGAAVEEPAAAEGDAAEAEG